MSGRHPLRILQVCGARPNFVKVAPLIRAYEAHPELEYVLVHTGQHYDDNMSAAFFADLGIPAPDVNLEVGSGSHAVQTAEIMRRFEPMLLQHRPDWVVVVGDVNSTLASALVASKLGVKVAHVEAGLRSFDRTMPEEINRILTDAISDLLLVSEPSGVENLRREGIPESKIHLVGNVMIDSLRAQAESARQSTILDDLRVEPRGYVVVTLHRPNTVDDPVVLSGVLDALTEISHDVPVLFAAHPRTRQQLSACATPLDNGVRLIDPLGYRDFLRLMSDARVVVTDSGGMQEETTILGIPCLTLRKNTERPITVQLGTNRLIEPARDALLAAWNTVRDQDRRACDIHYWDGTAAVRIADLLASALD